MKSPGNQNNGFTLIELLVALTLLALIVNSAAPVMQLSAKRDKEYELKRALWQVRDAIDAYKQAVEDGRVVLSDEATGYPSSLKILVEGVEDKQDPEHKKIYFLRRIPRDPFASDPKLSNEDTWGIRSYASSFDEKATGTDVYDIYSLSNGIGINQQYYKEW